MRNKYYLIIAVVLCLVLSACSAQQAEEAVPYDPANEYVPSLEYVECADDDFYKISLLVNSERRLLFASKDEIQDGLSMRKFYVKDLSSGENIFEFSNENGFYINEYEVIGNNIYWVFMDETGSYIQRFDVETSQIDTIGGCNAILNEYILSSDEVRYLTYNDSSSGKNVLYAYDVYNGTTRLVSDSILGNEYTEGVVFNGTVVVHEKNEIENVIAYYNLSCDQRTTISIPSELDAVQIMANDDWTVFKDGYDFDSIIYILNNHTSETKKLDVVNKGDSVFSAGVYEKYAIVNLHNGGQGRLIAVNLEDGSEITLSEDFVFWPNISYDGFLSVKCMDGRFLVFDLNTLPE